MSNFNPNAPDTLGVEMRPEVEASTRLLSSVRGVGMAFTAQATETINQAVVYVASIDEPATWQFEMVNPAATGDLNTTVTACMPADDVRNVGAFAQFDDGSGQHVVDIWQAIDSYPDPLFRGQGLFWNSGVPIDNDELIYPNFGRAMDYAARFNGVTGSSGTKRIVSVRLMAYVQEYVDIAFVAGMSLTPYLLINGVPYYAPTGKQDAPETEGGFLCAAEWTFNPAIGCGWVTDDLDQFDSVSGSTGTSGAGWLVDATGSSNNLPTILQGWLEIETSDDAVDPRETIGCIRPTRPGWWTIDLVDPVTGAAGWNKAATQDYVPTMRRRTGNGKLGWRYLGGDIDASTMESVDVTYTTSTELVASVGDEGTDKAYALIFITDGGDVSVDSQPYASADGDVQLELGINDDWSAVNVTQTLEQEFTTAGADTYGWVRVMARLDAVANEDLRIRILNGADVQQGSTLTFSPSDLVRPATDYQMLEGSIGPTALLAATQYRIVIDSTADPDESWRVQVLSGFLEGGTAFPPAGIGEATFGGTVDALTVDGTRHDEMDAVVTIATQPDTPEDLLADVGEGVNACDEFVTLSWTPTDVAADAGFFMRYEVDYSADAGTSWERIGEITDEDVAELEHHSAKRNVEGSYRIRVRRTDWSASAWSSLATATPVMTCCGYILTSDVAPELTLWADDVGPERATKPLQTVQMQHYYGRDHTVAHHSLEWAGVRFTRTLLLAAEGVVAGNLTPDAGTAGEETYGPLISLLPSKGAALPYITLLDQTGDRWFVSMELGDWTHDGVGNMFTADVTFTTVTDIPSPIDLET